MSLISIYKTIELLSKFNLISNGYNIINTLTYSILGIIVYFFVVYPYLIFRKVKINLNFILSVCMFILIGSILRMFSLTYTSLGNLIMPSSNPLSFGFYFYYPHLFIFLGLLFLIAFESSLFVSKLYNLNFEKTLIVISSILLLPLLLLFLINLINVFLFFKIILFSSILFLIVYYLFKLFNSNFFKNNVSLLALFSQTLDGFTTFFSLVFIKAQFIEKHVVSHLVISISPYLFLLVKISFCVLLLFLIDKYIKNEYLNNYFKLFIIIIGFTTGLRNLFMIALLLWKK